jgi:hypothetical protein
MTMDTAENTDTTIMARTRSTRNMRLRMKSQRTLPPRRTERATIRRRRRRTTAQKRVKVNRQRILEKMIPSPSRRGSRKRAEKELSGQALTSRS